MYLFYDLIIGKYGYDVTRPCRHQSGRLGGSFQDCLLDRLLNDDLENFLPQIDHLFSLSPNFTISRKIFESLDQVQVQLDEKSAMMESVMLDQCCARDC